MLQQTRVAAVIDHYNEFLRRFPSLLSLALAPEADVLAAWSGLGYYRRARMLHKAAQFITEERAGILPSTAAELRTLPGIGEYTSAAIASIAFGENIAVVDGNVERVLLRITGRPEEATAAARAFLRRTAQDLMPAVKPTRTKAAQKAANQKNLPAEHNQAMMELGATICLPRSPLCLECPVFALCRTRGEHTTPPRAKLRSSEVACLLSLRKSGVATQVLLAKRPAEAALMAGMYELPPLDAGGEELSGREPVLRLRHAITNTSYYVRVYAPLSSMDSALRAAVPLAKSDLHWVRTTALGGLPLTGLTRKALQRLNVMAVQPLQAPQPPDWEERPTTPISAKKQPKAPIVDLDEDHDSF
jgi:A/G-specific adenine glycosylase